MRDFIVNLDNLTIDFKLRGIKTIIQGDSSTGKTYVYESIHSEYTGTDIFLIDYHDVEMSLKAKSICNMIKQLQNTVIIVDQANDVFDTCPELEEIVDTDIRNTYILMGRSLSIHHNISDMAELSIVDGVAQLKYMFPLPL